MKTQKPKSTKKKSTLQPKKSKEAKKVVAEIVSDDQEVFDSPQPIITEDQDSNKDLESPVLVPTISEKLAPTKSVAVQDPLAMYLAEIRKYPLLSKEDELKLAKKYYDTKDPEAAQLLVKSNLRFVVKIASEYAKFSSKMIDLIQEGNIGLMHAVKEYNPYKGVRLITYAVWWIRGYIQEYLMRQFSLVRIGTTANQRKLFYQLQRQKKELESMSSPEYIEELSKQLGIPEDEIIEMSKRLSQRDVSLDKPSNPDDDESATLGSLLKKEDGLLPLDEQLALQEQIKYLHQAIDDVKDQLSDKEKIILEERVMNDEPLTLQEIGEKYKITREAVRQNEVRLIQKIKTALGKYIRK